MINASNFNIDFNMIFFIKKNLCNGTKLALSQPLIAKFQTLILEFSINALLNNVI